MMYLALTHGSRGIAWWCYNHARDSGNWAAYEAMYRELQQLAPYLLETAPGGVAVRVEPDTLHASAHARGSRCLVLAANPGTSVVEVDQDTENGSLVYEVTLDNGLEVQVDAGSGEILGTDQEEADSEAGDVDNVQEEIQNQDDDSGQEQNDLDDVQEEFESQADDVQEAPGVEDAPGQ